MKWKESVADGAVGGDIFACKELVKKVNVHSVGHVYKRRRQATCLRHYLYKWTVIVNVQVQKCAKVRKPERLEQLTGVGLGCEGKECCTPAVNEKQQTE